MKTVSTSAVKAVFKDSLKLKPHESCLIVTDTIKEKIAKPFYEYALAITSKAKLVVMKPRTEHGEEPPRDVAKEMLRHDVELFITDKSLSHTKARRNASKKGSRIASMPTITEEIINRCLSINYEKLRRDCKKLCSIISGAKKVKIRTSLGTDFTAIIRGKKVCGRKGGSFDRRGAFGNLPEGEISFSPTNSYGIYVVDASFPGLGKLKTPLIFKVKNNRVYEIEGEFSREVKRRLRKVGKKAFIIAEIGIGTNPKARVTGNVLEDEKVLGTAHIACGNNISYGGRNNIPLHLDAVMRQVDIYVNEKLIMRRGKPLW